jgi:hypothetical protein
MVFSNEIVPAGFQQTAEPVSFMRQEKVGFCSVLFDDQVMNWFNHSFLTACRSGLDEPDGR